jgi:methionine aminotransferase
MNDNCKPLAYSLPQKIPNDETTVFTVMTALAQECNAINLGQGFPDFSCSPALAELVTQSIQKGYNQYAPMNGAKVLRDQISLKIKMLYGQDYSSDHEITITAGATQAIFTAILSCVEKNDEVIIIEPAFDSYLPAIYLAGGIPIPVQMTLQADPQSGREKYCLPWDKIKEAISDQTRLIIVNSPHNPTGTVWTEQDIETLYDVIKDHDILVISDEVYEHMVFDQKKFCSIASHDGLASRSFVISSFGKTFHATGWKIAYVAAPHILTKHFQKIHQYNVFSVNHPIQHAIAAYLNKPEHYFGLSSFYQEKRDLFQNGLQKTSFKLLNQEGTYFQCVNYRELHLPQSKLSEYDFCVWLTKEIGVNAIPLSSFYLNRTENGHIRFCFAKQNETLQNALKRLSTLNS